MTPLEIWIESAHTYSPRRLPPHSTIIDLVGKTKKRSLIRSRIEIHSLIYSSPELTQYANTHNHSKKVTVKYDPGDISKLYVIDSEEGRSIEAQCSSRRLQHYAQGLSEHAHQVICRHALRNRPIDEGRLTVKELLTAKNEIIDFVELLLKRKSVKGVHTRLARFMENWSQHYQIQTEVDFDDSDIMETLIDGTSDEVDDFGNIDLKFQIYNSPSSEMLSSADLQAEGAPSNEYDDVVNYPVLERG